MSSSEQSTIARHEYRMKAWYRSLLLILGASAVSGGIVMCWLAQKGFGSALPVAMTMLFLGFGIYLILLAQRSRVIIESDRIEVRGAFKDRAANLQEIKGYRTISSRNGKYTQIYLKSGRAAVTLSNLFDHDDAYNSWFRKLRNLDKQDRDALLERISNEQELGATPQERLAALSQARSYSILALFVALAAAVAANWGIPALYVPFSLVLALLPVTLAVMMHRAPLLYMVFKQRDDPRAELFYALIISSFGLLIRARAVHFIALRSLGIAIAFMVLMYIAAFHHAVLESRSRLRVLFALLMFGALYGYGVVVVADAIGDPSTPARYVVHVTGKHYTTGRSRSYYLQLEPWGPMQRPNSLGVSKTIYDKASPGDQICLELRPGRLKAAWYTQVSCQAGQMDPRPLSDFLDGTQGIDFKNKDLAGLCEFYQPPSNHAFFFREKFFVRKQLRYTMRASMVLVDVCNGRAVRRAWGFSREVKTTRVDLDRWESFDWFRQNPILMGLGAVPIQQALVSIN